MTISIDLNKKVVIENTVFSCAEFFDAPKKYMPLVEPLFRASSLVQRDGESNIDRLARLFHALYYRKGYAADHVVLHRNINTTNTTSTVRSAAIDYTILSKLGFDIVRQCPKTSKIVFKQSGNEYKIHNYDLNALLDALQTKSSTFKHANKEIKFGVELEFISNADIFELNKFGNQMRALVGDNRYINQGCYHHNNGEQWELGRDSSVRGRDKRGFELTSPIYTCGNKEDMIELSKVIDLVKTTLHGEVNKTCGTHVHMSFDCGGTSIELSKYFAQCYSNNEESLFDRLVPKNRQYDNNQYCGSVNPEYISSRYHKLNLTLVESHSKNMHIEFRQLDGTLDIDKLTAWINLQKLFVNIALYNYKNKKVQSMKLENILTSSIFNESDIENFMKMSKLAA